MKSEDREIEREPETSPILVIAECTYCLNGAIGAYV